MLKPPPPVASWMMKTATLIPISVKVAGARQKPTSWTPMKPPPLAAGRRTSVLSPEHSGQRMPTEVGVMQSPQIGRSHREQETRVSRSGWR